MTSIQLWQKYKNRPIKGNINFLNWVETNYPDLNIRGFYNIFISDWLDGNINRLSSKTFVVWLCKNYRVLDYYENT